MDIALILTRNYPGTLWTLEGDTYEGLAWLDESPKPTEAELEKLWAQVQYDIAYEMVSLARHAAYTSPTGSDAVFMQYQRGEATEQDWLDAVNAINAANPYPKK